MTPELKTACEVVFQEHKASNQIKWNKDSFRGQISIGLSELAKETLVKKHIIILPNKSKKIVTLLNPAVAGATSVEEAEKMIENKIVPARAPASIPVAVVVAKPVADLRTPKPVQAKTLKPSISQPYTRVTGIKWYMKPFFYYVLWPVCAAVAGAVLTFLISKGYSELFGR